MSETSQLSRLLGRLRPFLRHAGVAAGIAVAFFLGMCLTGNSTAPGPAGGHAHDQKEQIWTCPMHPQIRQNSPGTCPICGMDLVPVDDGGDGSSGSSMERITLSDRARILASIRTTEVRLMPQAAREVRLLGRVDYDETQLKTVTAWTGGRIDRLVVSTTGQRIRPGQIIARLYSPEIYAAQSDLIQAAQQAQKLGKSSDLARTAAAAAMDAARQRLRLLGVPAGEIKAMEKAASPSRNVAIRSPFGGTVIERLVDEGNYVSAGSALYKVADLSRVWVQLDAYESDTPLVAVGDKVSLEVTGLAGRTFEGKVAFIDPVVDPRKRTSRVRVEVKNPEGVLRPGMFAEATLQADIAGTAHGDPDKAVAGMLMIPDTAPLFTGLRSIVYVEVPGKERPAYEVREVELGARVGAFYPVLSGLELGERVVIRGAFVLDADLQIKGGASMMTRPDDRERLRHTPIKDVPAPLATRLAPMIRAYLAVQESLAADDLEQARTHSKELLQTMVQASTAVPERLRAEWDDLTRDLEAYARYLSGAGSMNVARKAFEELTKKTIVLLERFGNPGKEEVHLAYCPMAFDGRGASWVQRGDTIDNPYFGARMRSCGEFRGQAEPGAYLHAGDDQDDSASEKPEPRAPAASGHQH